jgi:hypothetical protein
LLNFKLNLWGILITYIPGRENKDNSCLKKRPAIHRVKRYRPVNTPLAYKTYRTKNLCWSKHIVLLICFILDKYIKSNKKLSIDLKLANNVRFAIVQELYLNQLNQLKIDSARLCSIQDTILDILRQRDIIILFNKVI